MISPRLWPLMMAWGYNRVRFLALRERLRGRVEFGPECDVWTANLRYRGNGRVVLGRGSVVSRENFPTMLDVEPGGEVLFDEEVWLRGKYRPNIITCQSGGRIEIARGSILNGTIVTARSSVKIGLKAMISWNTTILDSDLHAVCNDELVRTAPVEIGDYVILCCGVTVLPGVSIGSHTMVGAGSVVSESLPDHVLAAGVPARVIRKISDRDLCP